MNKEHVSMADQLLKKGSVEFLRILIIKINRELEQRLARAEKRYFKSKPIGHKND